MTMRSSSLPKYAPWHTVAAAVIERFNDGFMTEPNTGCWLWLRSLDKHGYGSMTIKNPSNDGPHHFFVRASAVSMAIKNRQWPSLYVLHSCDLPCCVNPTHLREGTQKENVTDMDMRDRRGVKCYSRGDSHHARKNPTCLARGEANGMAKITLETARLIHLDILAGKTNKQIAVERGTTRYIAHQIRIGNTWKHAK